MIKSRKQMYLAIGAFALVLMLGTVTYAFFNYTRTGSANTIRTGRIAFNTEQGTAINLTNMFPIDVSNGIPNDATKVGSVTIHVTGDTSYSEGMEYLVSAVNVQNTIGSGVTQKTLPISIDVSVASNTENDPATTLGTSDSDYFTNRGASASSSIYKVLAGETINTNDQLLVGYIKSGATGVDGNIVIRAYLDKAKIAITDTYTEGTVTRVIETGYTSAACETALTGVTNASTYCATVSSLQNAIDNGNLTAAQITLLVNAGLVEEYTNVTTSNWVNERTVFTTTEWNSLQTNGISFQVKVESNEGIWVEDSNPPLASCPGEGCVYSSTYELLYTKRNTLNETSTVLSAGDYSTNYQDVLIDGYHSFYGFVLNNNSEIERAYLCGLKDDTTLFCIEAVESKKEQNKQFLNSDTLWNNTCDYDSLNNPDTFYCPLYLGDPLEFRVWISDDRIGSSDGWRLLYNGHIEMS